MVRCPSHPPPPLSPLFFYVTSVRISGRAPYAPPRRHSLNAEARTAWRSADCRPRLKPFPTTCAELSTQPQRMKMKHSNNHPFSAGTSSLRALRRSAPPLCPCFPQNMLKARGTTQAKKADLVPGRTRRKKNKRPFTQRNNVFSRLVSNDESTRIGRKKARPVFFSLPPGLQSPTTTRFNNLIADGSAARGKYFCSNANRQQPQRNTSVVPQDHPCRGFYVFSPMSIFSSIR